MALGVGNFSGKMRAEQTSVPLRKEAFTQGEKLVSGGSRTREGARAGVTGEELPWSHETAEREGWQQ